MPKNILIVDDDPVVIKLLDSRLSAHGYTVTCARDGEEGLVKTKQLSPDLIIVDYFMPKLDGFAFLKRLKGDDALKGIPAIILTARPQMKESFLAIGADVFLTKPFLIEELLTKIESLLAATVPQVSPELFPPQKQSHKKILICGDPDVAQEINQLLELHGCHTNVALNSEEVIEKAREFDPDFILLETFIGGVSAPSVIKTLRKTPGLSQKIILVFRQFASEGMGKVSVLENAGSDEYHLNICMAVGANKYLGRFDPSNFIELLGQFLFD